MHNIFHIITLLASLFAAQFLTGCGLNDLTQAEPDQWERNQFERSVAKSVRKAVNMPGIDNGSTLIITSHGDTLLAPVDTVFLRADLRTVYVDIQSPEYPKGMTSRAMNFIEGVTVTAVISGMILLILLGIFIIVVRRQHGRNSLIKRAIEHGYTLPESFYTGVSKAPDVTVNQIITPEGSQAPAQGGVSDGGDCPPPPPSTPSTPSPGINIAAVKDAVKEAAGLKASATPLRDLRNGMIMVGIGLIIFISFAIGDNPAFGFFVGGILAVLGGAKIFTYYCGRNN